MLKWVVDTTKQQAPAGTILFALFWSALVGLFCLVVGSGAVLQIATDRWPVTEGTVTVSELTGRKRNSWKLEYQYTVAGQPYTGTRYAFEPMPIQGEREVTRAIAAHPAGSAVAVSYNPDDPAEGVIRPGLRGCTLWMALFLTPFVIVGLAMWVGLVRRYRSWPAFDPDNPRQVAMTDTGALVVRPEPKHSLDIFLTYLGVSAFATAWVVMFVGVAVGVLYLFIDGSALDPPVEGPAAVWAVVLVGCALATWRTARRAAVLTIDARAEMILVQRGGGSAVEVPIAEVLGVFVTAIVIPSREGRLARHRVELARAGRAKSLVVAEYDDERDADAFAEWLRQRVQPAAGSLD
jgi:hypothetical protein